jgi:F-type H+-transporting ATPase subunit b
MQFLVPAIGLIFWTFIAFIIVLIIFRKYAWKRILSTIKERETGIADAIASAEKMKAEMAALKNENEALMAKAREERAVILKEAKEHSDKMIAVAKEKAKQEYERIVADAQNAIVQQKNAALTDVKTKVGSLVIEVSEKILQRELSNKTEQEKYIQTLVNNVPLN